MSFLIYILTQILYIILEQYIKFKIANVILITIFILQTIILHKLFIKTQPSNIRSGNFTIKLYISLAIVGSFLLAEIGFLRFISPGLFNTKMTFNNLGSLFFATIFFPIYEELITRGMILNMLNKRFSFPVANVFQAIIFSILHFSLHMILLYFVFGLILGIVKKNLNIYYCILIHVLINMCVFLLSTQIVNLHLPNIPDYFFLIIGFIFLIVTLYVTLNINKFIDKCSGLNQE